MARRPVSNPLALAVLSYLSDRPMHPYELSRSLREHGDTRSIRFNHGSLYMVVGQLTKAGLITEQGTTREGQRPERTVYSLTDAGRAELCDWLADLLANPQHEYPVFVTALSLVAALPPDRVVTLLRSRLNHLATLRSEITKLIKTSLASDVPDLFLVEERYRLALLDTEVRFVKKFLDQITDPDTAWLGQWTQFHYPGTTTRRTK